MKILRIPALLGAAAACCVLLSGCAEMPGMSAAVARLKEVDTKRDLAHVAPAVGAAPASRPSFEVSDTAYITNSRTGASQRVVEEKALPPSFGAPYALLYGPTPVTVARVLRDLETDLQMPVRLAADVYATPSGSPPSAPGVAIAAGLAPPFAPAATSQPQSSSASSLPPIELNVRGTRRDVLKLIASKLGLEFDYVNGEVVFSRLVTRVFALEGSPRSITSHDSFASSASSAGSGGTAASASSASNTLAIESVVKAFDDLENQLKALKSPTGQIVLSRSQNSVLVRDTRAVVDDAAIVIDRHNAMMSRQVFVELEVVSLTMDKNKAAGFDASLAFQRFASGIPSAGISFTGPPSLVSNGGSLIFSVNTNDRNTSNWGGSKLFVDALNQFGTTHTVNKSQGYGRNNTPITFDSQNERSYISQITPAPAGGSGTGSGTPGITQSTVTTGFLARVYPTILSGNRVMLDSVLNMSNLDDLVKASSGPGGMEVQSPNVSRKIAPNGVILPSGAYVAMQAYEREVSSDKSNRALLAFSRASGNQVERVFIVMRATILSTD